MTQEDLRGQDLRWLDAAARIAMPWRGTTAENPTVGALVVSPDGRLLGRGVTAPGGRPHAEPQAIAMAGEGARGATLYVTLEPCAHWGQTPPCVDAIIAAGLARVVIGLPDPDPRTAGQSIARLRQSGLQVDLIAVHASSGRLHEGYLSRIIRKRPFVTLKLALSSDGMIGRPDTDNTPITGDVARVWTHMQRALSDAIIVGANTARLDAPKLSVRLSGLTNRRPLRVVFAGRNPVNLPPSEDGQGTLFIDVSSKEGGLATALETLAARGINAVLVEGGATLANALLDAGLVDRVHLLESDVVIGPGGVPASVHSPLPDRLHQLGFTSVAERALGCDRLRSFERS